jgi:hypothetical protein
LDWHWSAGEDRESAGLKRRIGRLIAEGYALSVSFDRGAVPLAEGLQRGPDAARGVLDYIALSLPLIWRDAGSPRVLSAIEDGLARTVQLAVRAAVQRREFLRRVGPHPPAPALDQAALALSVLGLDWTIQQWAGKSIAEDGGALKLALNLIELLRHLAEREARFFGLAVVLDAPPDAASVRSAPPISPRESRGDLIIGLHPWNARIGPRAQIHAAGQLHAVARAGTFTCPRDALSGDEIESLIDWTLHNTSLNRLAFSRIREDRYQLSAFPLEQDAPGG